MRSAAVLAFAAGALAVPYKRDVVTHYDYVYETDVVTVWANQQASSSVAVAAEPAPTTSSAAGVAHYGHNHWSGHSSQAATTESATPSSTSVAPTTPTSTYVPPPPPTSTYAPPPPPTTTSTSVAPPPTTTWAAPTSSTSAAWVAPTSAAAPAKPSDYASTVVFHHNLHRANHSAPDIAWSDDLASSAQQIAASCVYAHNTQVAGGGYGQNIAAGVEANNISAIITDLFYNGEVGWYEGLYGQDQPDMTHFENWGHFSQIVWKSTTHVGCATQYCPNGLGNVGDGVSPYFTVCNYKDPGNFANEYGKNVGASLKQKTAEWNAGM